MFCDGTELNLEDRSKAINADSCFYWGQPCRIRVQPNVRYLYMKTNGIHLWVQCIGRYAN